MKFRRLRNDFDLAGKRVLVRIDGNVPIKNGKAVDGPHGRIARAAVDIDWMVQRGAKVIVLSHLGRPNGKRVPAFSLKPVAKRLGGLLKTRVTLSRELVGKKVQKLVDAMKNGDVLLLENLRFDAREEANAASFAQALAALADVYVNDAFAVSHREHASVDAIATEIPSFAGPLLANEVAILSKLNTHVKEPFVLVMGGMKVETKLPVIERFLPTAKNILLGGALASAFLVASGCEVGRSVYDREGVKQAKKMLSLAGGKLLIPTDVIVAGSLRKDAKTRIVSVDAIRAADRIVDLGPKTVALFLERIESAKTIVWNGPLGVCEVEKFCAGTYAIARAIAAKTGSTTTVVGGGDTVPMLEAANLADKFSLLSTGGGALLEYLAGKKLPGLEVLESE